MNSKGREIADAIEKELAMWPGVTVEFADGTKHPKAKLIFDGKRIFQPFSGTPSDSYAIVKALADVRRALRDLGAERTKPEPSAEDESAEYRKANEGREKRPDPVKAEPVIQKDPKAPLAELAEKMPVPKAQPIVSVPRTAEPDPTTLAGRTAIARGDGWLADGEHEIDEERYHYDPCEETSLSSSLAKRMIEYSPWHAWTAHPRYNPDFEPIDKLQLRIGKAFHKLMLGKGADIAVLEYKDYKTNAAKEDRDQALADGLTPMLEHQMEKLEKQVRSAKRQIQAREEMAYALAGGVPERVFIWTEQTPAGPVRCRMMADWTPHQGNLALDFKSTQGSAGPNEWGQKVMWQIGCDIQDSFYRRGWRAVLGRDFDAIIFGVVENEAPWAMMHHRCDHEAQSYADREVQWAINAFGICKAHNRWPGYPREMAWQQRPGWRSARIEQRYETEERDLAALDAYLANLKEVGSVPRREGGAEVTDENPFGLDRIEE